MTSSDSGLRSGLLFRRIVDEGLLLDLEADVGYSLNEVGARILELLSEGEGRDRVVERLCSEFEIEEAQCQREVEAFLEELRSRGLLPHD